MTLLDLLVLLGYVAATFALGIAYQVSEQPRKYTRIGYFLLILSMLGLVFSDNEDRLIAIVAFIGIFVLIHLLLIYQVKNERK